MICGEVRVTDPTRTNKMLDVKKLLPDGLLTDGVLSGACRVYNLENCISSDLNGEKVGVLLFWE